MLLPKPSWLAALSVWSATTSFVSPALASQASNASDDSLLWGPYRPNLYFGVRPRIPKSLLMGLMWGKVEDYSSIQDNFRYTCEQNEGMAGYGWTEYSTRRGGTQTIHDAGNDLDLTTEFIKIPGGSHGGNWGVRVRGTPREGAAEDLKSTVIVYLGMEGLVEGAFGKRLECTNEQDSKGIEGPITLEGETEGLGSFKVEIVESKENKHPEHTHPSADDRSLDRSFVKSMAIPEDAMWQTKAVVFSSLKQSIDAQVEKYTRENLPPPYQFFTLEPESGAGNAQVVQKVFEGAFEFDVLFSSDSSPKPISSEDLTREIKAVTKSFSEQYDKILKPQAPFNGDRYDEFSKSLFSNLLGGIGYFYGDYKVDRSYASEYEEENEGFWEETEQARARAQVETEGPDELFTLIPSRTFFPRGFLWDEGFHLLPVLDWDADLTLEVIKSWFKLIDEEGWIAREQILGPEARSKVPPEFQVQYPHYANPPTLFLVLTSFIDKLKSTADYKGLPSEALSHPDATKQYLQELYPLLKRHYNWFRRTQAGDVKSYDRTAFSTKEAYRWRGRTPKHILPSGLDDYPRAQPPYPGELHVDAISWVGLMATSLKKIATYLGETEDIDVFGKQEIAIKKNIDDLHWSAKDKAYCDASMDDYEEHTYVCHKGYMSLFPFMTGLLDAKSEHLGAVLDLIADPDELWSDFGIRSLSKKSEHYGTDENYWRSPIWVNMNYLIVERLLKFAQTKGPHQAKARQLYIDLRRNLVETVYKSWLATGFAWEQYNPETGAGQRTQHFTGWTSLIVKVMAWPDLGKATVRDEL